ncbi:hypothetical protein [Aeribacillus phage AP45]|uniref:Uncharacterized protein n=1 Tax=Aeribacillus phage AP45 TaxID=1913112 RepID=A0A1L2JY47_9CAUD|nr:hypothetical protein HWD36_gp34 [Aeribacillus phage AP45]APC46483.1 hypothetical protein [Aeribacillus phage AP45]
MSLKLNSFVSSSFILIIGLKKLKPTFFIFDTSISSSANTIRQKEAFSCIFWFKNQKTPPQGDKSIF